MNISEVKNRAREIGVMPGRLKKADLIRTIQIAEGNHPSFGTNDGTCPHAACCWRDDCLKEFRKSR